MEENNKNRIALWTPLLFSLILIAGMTIGFNLRDTLRNKRDVSTVFERNDRLEEIIDLIDENYVDSINRNMLYKNAIEGILKNLDPHTTYIAAEDVANENDELDGTFSGIGIEFAIVRDTLHLTAVFSKGPAEKAGLSIGDQLIKVDDSIVAGNNINTERLKYLLRGKKLSKVGVTYKSGLTGKVADIQIIRDKITVSSVVACFMLDSVTGYIKIDKFTSTSYEEFCVALKNLQDAGAKQLVLDLRENPGGYLEAATSIADEFLNERKLIVFTKGIHTSRTEYRASERGKFESGRLAILIDESAASASEILTGAIQDWDRGIVVGRRTFGKGLVQEQYEMADGAGLRLTVAKYYTPSGRCIQRSFADGKEAYSADFQKRFESGELLGKSPESLISVDTTPFYTANNRIVYGGGGIKPDVFVPYDSAKLSSPVLYISYSETLKTALWDCFSQNRATLNYRSLKEFTDSFKNEDLVIKSYLLSLKPKQKKVALKLLSNAENYRYLKSIIKAQIGRLLFYENGYYAVSLKEDNVVNKAMSILNSNAYLKIIRGK